MKPAVLFSCRRLVSFTSVLMTFFLAVSVLNAETSPKTLAETPRKMFIELGWDIPSTQFMRDNYRTMEENAPFSGVIYRIQPEGREWKESSEWMFSAEPWKREDYASCITDLKACDFKEFTHNFIRMNFSPASIAWDDDAGWEILAEKAAICAWVAKQSGSKGLAPDFESYGAAMFRWDPAKQNGRSFAEAKALARKRGEQFIRAIASEYPDATILALWLNSINAAAGKSRDPDSILVSAGYGLLPAFINGMIAGAPEEMVLVDGCETGYYIEGEAFKNHALDMVLWTGACMNLVEPELRQKYRTQVQCGFGIYLDMYTNPEGSVYYRGPKKDGGSRLDRLCGNLEAAFSAADQYVWIYGEKNRWWNVPEVQNPEKPCVHWETALPGLSDRIQMLAEPEKALEKIAQRVREGKEGENCLKNPSFEDVKDGKPAEWNFWQDEKEPTGRHFADTQGENGIVSFEKLASGCVLQFVDVQPGERLFFQVRVRTGGDAQAKVNISWQDEKGWGWAHTQYFPFDPNEKGEWKTIRGCVTTPEGISKMGMILGASHQNAPEDSVSYDAAEVYRLK